MLMSSDWDGLKGRYYAYFRDYFKLRGNKSQNNINKKDCEDILSRYYKNVTCCRKN
jgi:hypothetical protein